MQTTEDSAIIRKTLELCQAILNEPEFSAMRRQMEDFENDSQSQTQLQSVMSKGDELQRKQSMGMPMSGEELTAFESERTELLANPVAKAYLDAQETMHRIRMSVDQYVMKTFELGRLPENDDFESEGCGSSCGCGH